MSHINHNSAFNGPKDWQLAKAPTFWGAIAIEDHVVQIYEKDEILIDALAGYVGDGINCGDACVIIATQEHISALNKKLREHGLYIDALIADNRYVPLDAETILSKFVINGWPDAPLLFLTISEMLAPIEETGRRIRAFGEMVALLWQEGNKQATLQLENLWNSFCEKEPMTLYCAYPGKGFVNENQNSFSHIFCTHSLIISGSENQMSDIVYRRIESNHARSA